MRSKFIGFVRKENHHILRDRRTLLVLFGMPIIMMMLFGFAIRNELKDIELAVVDPSRDEATVAIVEKLQASGYFEVVDVAPGGLEAAFREGRIMEAVIFEPEFARRIARDGWASVQVITDATNPNAASTALAYTTAVVRDVERAVLRGGATRTRTALAARIGAGTESITPSLSLAAVQPTAAGAILPEFRMRYNPELESAHLFVPGLIAIILMLVSALMTSITIAREKEQGTMEVLLVSPLNPFQIVAGKVLPYLAISMVNVVTILVPATLVFGVPVRGSIVLLFVLSFLFTICALALGILISSRSNSLQTATMVALAGLLMPTVLLSGFIFPIASMPEALQVVSHVVPAKWFLIIVRGVMIRGVGLEFLWKEVVVLLGMTALFGIASMRSFNTRLE